MTDDRDRLAGFDADELAEFEAFLRSPEGEEAYESLSAMDGFMTAVALTPEVIPEAEWLAVALQDDEDETDPADPEERVMAEASLCERMAQLRQVLAEGDEDHEPMLVETEGGEVMPDAWADGFMAGVRMRPRAWMPILQDDTHHVLVTTIGVLCSPEELEAHGTEFGLSEHALAEHRAKAPATIPAAVRGIRSFWLSRSAGPVTLSDGARFDDAPLAGTAAPQPIPTTAVGRNEPCPCGSGKKHKRCCGAG